MFAARKLSDRPRYKIRHFVVEVPDSRSSRAPIQQAVVTTRVPKPLGRRMPSGAKATPSREDDDALIADVVAGKPERAAAFCQRVWRTVDRTVRRLLGHDDSEYDDLVQPSIV